MEVSDIFFKNVFLIFQKRDIHNPGIFRTRITLRTLTYLELEAYSGTWYIQNLRHIQNTVKHLQVNVFQE